MTDMLLIPAPEKKNLYCAMLHLACYLDDARKGREANYFKACEFCKISKDCGYKFYDRVSDLAKSVGIIIGPCIMEADYQVHYDTPNNC